MQAGYLCNMVEVKVPEARIRRADSYSIFRALLDQSPEPADVTLFSFSVAEVWIRRFMDLKAAGRIRRLTVCANFEIMGRQTTPCMMLDGICDAFYLTNTHAKMLYMEDAGGGHPRVAVTSANLTENYRVEAYFTTDDPDVCRRLKEDMHDIFADSVKRR